MWLAISGVLILIGVIFLSARGLNLGIDFTSGTLIQIRFDHPVRAAEARAILRSQELADLQLGKSIIQPLDENDLQIRAKPLTNDQIQKVVNTFRTRLGGADLLRTEMVGPVVGKELIQKAIWAVIVSSIGIIAYMTWRFEFKFAVAGIIALLHDVVMILGVFAILGREVGSPFVAAVLTIMGYSINDTIVVFDKIRENLKFRKKETLEELVNKSILQTLTRSINTIVTTLLAVIAIYLFGGATIRDFSLALIVGLVCGSYSSIFIASPIWLMWKEWERERQKKVALAR